jgi:formate-dependent nitrite reductase membrane component NrfD
MAEPLRIMAFEAAVLVALEVLAIVFFLQSAFSGSDARESAERILRRRSFVLGYFLLGLAVPLVLMMMASRSPTGSNLGIIFLGAALGLVGGLILRQSVLVCGALPTLNMGGFEFRRIARPKEPKPGIGLMPPT